jgi:glucokinase
MILAGDIGGTHTRLALFDPGEERLTPLGLRVYQSRKYEDLGEIARDFLGGRRERIAFACFAVACPVQGGRCETPNLAWVVDSNELASGLSLDSVEIVNDLVANAYGIEVLEEDDFEVLSSGTRMEGGNAALISAGTGLGEAGLFRDRSLYRPFASEGGHSDFAPRGELEVELLRFLGAQFGHVSVERVLSGPGLYNIYRFLRERSHDPEPGWLSDQIAAGDPPAVITQEALAGRSETCGRGLDLFVSIYGAEAGNLALKFMATGGVYIGGGIAPKIVGKLKDGAFLESFRDKGRMRPILESVPLRVILNDKTALLGAANVARRRLSGS